MLNFYTRTNESENKQGYEDILRHITDRQINRTPIRILREGVFQNLKWKDVIVGDIVEVLSDEAIPCDMLLLMSSSDDQQCYITTANLDGESNLKVRSVPENFPFVQSEQDLSNYRAVITCDKPNLKLYEFNGTCTINNQQM